MIEVENITIYDVQENCIIIERKTYLKFKSELELNTYKNLFTKRYGVNDNKIDNIEIYVTKKTLR